jgi:hypothetical protein
MRMPQIEVLVIEGVATEDTDTPRSIAIHEVAALDHEVGDLYHREPPSSRHQTKGRLPF